MGSWIVYWAVVKIVVGIEGEGGDSQRFRRMIEEEILGWVKMG
jgi:hypothetical protein